MFLTTVYNTKHSLRVMEDVTLEGVGKPLTSYSCDNPGTVNHRVDIGLLPKAPPGKVNTHHCLFPELIQSSPSLHISQARRNK